MRRTWLVGAVALGSAAVLAVLLLPAAAPGHAARQVERTVPAALPVTAPVTVPGPTATASKAQPLVAWHGPVEELFVHPVVLHPVLAFRPDALGRGFADYFVTAGELRRVLEGLWRNGWTLVDVHRAAAGTVRVPPGRRPLVLSEDDANYYRYFAGRGLADRLVLQGDRVLAEADGATTDLDVVPLVEEAVAAHPELSADGAKGVLALTGYEGLLGEHAVAADPAARARVRALADRLRATGWTFASHTWGHLSLDRDGPATVARDTARWQALTAGLLGPVDVLVYPFGARPSPLVRRQLRDAGYRVQLDIDVRPLHEEVDGVTLMSRRHVDGLAFAVPSRLRPFFDVAAVRDPARP